MEHLECDSCPALVQMDEITDGAAEGFPPLGLVRWSHLAMKWPMPNG